MVPFPLSGKSLLNETIEVPHKMMIIYTYLKMTKVNFQQLILSLSCKCVKWWDRYIDDKFKYIAIQAWLKWLADQV